MAVTKSDKNKTLAAFTTAALSLPGLHASAAVPVAQIEGNASYGHYQESDNRMQVDVYHVDGIVPLTERLELAFSVDRDTYSGATPAFSMPVSMTNQPKYKQKDDGTPSSEVSYADVVSAASGGVTAAGLTYLGGLNGFQSFQDGLADAQEEINTNYNLAIAELNTSTNAKQAELDTSYDANQDLINANYEADRIALAGSDPAIAEKYQKLTTEYNTDVAAVNAKLRRCPQLSSARLLSILTQE